MCVEEWRRLKEREKVNEEAVRSYAISAVRSGLKFLKSQYFSYLYGKASEFLDELDFSGKDIPDITNETIYYLEKRGKCICGTDLTKNSECLNNLKGLLAFLPPESIGNQIRMFNNDASEQNNIMEDANKQYEDYYSSYSRQSDIQEGELSRIADLERKIVEKSPEDYQKNIDYLNARIRELRSLNQSYIGDLKRVDDELAKANEDLDQASKLDEANKPIREKMRYVEILATRASNLYEEESAKNLEEMQRTFEKVFSDMYHGKRKVWLSDKYEIIYSDNRFKLDPSKGLETVVNFAFVASLLKMAKERMKKGGDVKAEPYPLVMDAVFTNTDQKHIENISRQLPLLTEQAILALMDKDWKNAKPTLEAHLGKLYRIVKKSETESVIEEVI